MSEISVRIARADERGTLAALYEQWGYYGGMTSADIVYVAEIGRGAVGIVRRTVEEGVTMLRGMQVDPAYHRRGIGSQLLDAFARDIKELECFCIPFAHLTEFYGRIGFTVAAAESSPEFLVARTERYRLEGHQVLIMRRPAVVEEFIEHNQASEH
jgi:GNAT superfamily N-acetyltransferase